MNTGFGWSLPHITSRRGTLKVLERVRLELGLGAVDGSSGSGRVVMVYATVIGQGRRRSGPIHETLFRVVRHILPRGKLGSVYG